MTANKSITPAISRIAVILAIFAVLALLSCATKQTSTPIQQAPVQSTVPQIAIDYAWLDSVNLELHHCTRTHQDGRKQGFYLVGEIHVYNKPTSRYADTLLAILQPRLFLSEGVDSSQKEVFKKHSDARRDFFGQIGYGEPELSRLAEAREIPVVWLEQIDSTTGIHAGITPSEKEGLEVATAVLGAPASPQNAVVKQMMKKFLDNPEGVYKGLMKMLSQFGVDTLAFQKRIEDQPRSGIIDVRNELMTQAAIEYIVPENGCILIRFGMGHTKGMIEELAKHDCECEPISLQAFLESAR
ncbi:MAG: hypothetical protein IPH59_01450 [bacterium]|nr:hypothetical protein [bacterium]